MSSAGSDASGSLPRLNWTSVVEPAHDDAPATPPPSAAGPAAESPAPPAEPRWNPNAPVNLTAQLSALSIDMSFGGTAVDERPAPEAPARATSPELGGMPAAAMAPPATVAPAWPSSPLLGEPPVPSAPPVVSAPLAPLAPIAPAPDAMPRVSLPDVLRSALSTVPLGDEVAEVPAPAVVSGNSAVDTGARPFADRFRPAEPRPMVATPTGDPTPADVAPATPAATPQAAESAPLYGRLAFPDDPGEASALLADEEEEEPVEVPRIREATPVESAVVQAEPEPEPEAVARAGDASSLLEPAAAPVAHDLGTFEAPVPAAALVAEPVVAVSAPATPAAPAAVAAPPQAVAQPGAMSLPASTKPSRSDVAAIRFDKPVVMPATKPKRRIGAKIAKTLLLLAVLGGLGAAGYVYGMPYLFPNDWPAEVQPLADAVETAAGSEFVEPVQVETIASPQYDSFAVESLLSSSPHYETYGPTWRSLGLATGNVTDADLNQLVSMWAPSVYNTRNGQIVVESQLAASPARDAAVEVALAEALLDQQHQWSTDLSRRGIDERVTMRAVATGQAFAYANAAGADTSALVRDDNLLAFLPAPMAFELLAPYRVGPVLVGADPAAFDAMFADMARGASWPKVLTTTPAIAPNGDLATGDQIVVPPMAQGYSFWYMAFASYVDPIAASGLANSIEQDLLTSVDRAGQRCAIATFTPRPGSEAALAAGLAAWVAAAPAELGASSSVASNGALQLVSCDPGADFAGASRPMVAREALAVRLTEAAAVRYIVDQVGDDQAAMAAAVQLIRARDIGATVARDSASAPIDVLVAAAVDAATPVAQEALATAG